METEHNNRLLQINNQCQSVDPVNMPNQQTDAVPDEEPNELAAVLKLKNLIQKNLPGCDIVVCVFIAALKSFRMDQCLRPFPQYFMREDNEKDFTSLRKAADQIPPLPELLKLSPNDIPKDVVKLLLWLFVDSGIPQLTPQKGDDIPLSLLNERASINTLPQYIFQVNYSEKNQQAWNNRIGDRNLIYAFHGSVVSNFYSILKFGLQPHFSSGKEVLFGSGVYLSDEISVCTNYSPFGKTWPKSILGHKHSIIAVCTIINDEEEVKCQDKNNKRRSMNQNSLGEIPEKYFVVTNSELVKIKYLLVYSHKSTSAVTFVRKNFIWILIISYFFMLVFIGFLSGPTCRKFIRYLYSLME